MPPEQPWASLLCPFLFQEEENRLREELRQEWEAKQEKIKSESSWSGRHAARGGGHACFPVNAALDSALSPRDLAGVWRPSSRSVL